MNSFAAIVYPQRHSGDFIDEIQSVLEDEEQYSYVKKSSKANSVQLYCSHRQRLSVSENYREEEVGWKRMRVRERTYACGGSLTACKLKDGKFVLKVSHRRHHEEIISRTVYHPLILI